VSRQFIPGVNAAEVEWVDIDKGLPGAGDLVVTPGVRMAVLTEDPETGASTALYRMPPGWQTSGPESHTVLQEELVLEGEITIGGVSLVPGSYACFPPGQVHGPAHTEDGVLMLVMLSGPFDITYHPDGR
jgi:quercetin dioxygenase-like cupin family protein